MRLLLERSDALSALSRVTGVVARNSNIPILNNVLLSADGGALTIRGTDLDIQAVASCPAAIAEPGTLTVDANRLREIVSAAAPGAQISLEPADGDDPRLLIKSGRSKFRLPILDADQFPTISDDDWAAEYEIAAEVLSDMLARAAVSVSQDVSRPMLSGVYLHVDGKQLVAVGTSGFRLTRITTTAPAKSQKAPGVIIPTKTVAQVIKQLSDATECKVSVSKNKIRFEAGGSVIVSKVIDYEYVNYAKVIPDELPHVARIGSDAFSAAIRRAQIAGDVDQHGSGVKLTLSDGVMVVTGRNSETDALDEIEIEYEGPEIVVGATAAPLLDAIANLAGDTVNLNMLDGKTPVTITSIDDDEALQMLVQRRVA